MDQSAREALAKLKSVSSLLGQSVLLKGVNDHTRELLQLFETMLKNHIRPYYLHHPDQALGTAHYYVDLQRGRQLFAAIRGKLPGWAMPQYTLDLPGGAGKVNAFSDEVPENPGVFHSPFGIMHKYQTCPSKKVLQ
jgi:lysine 2,3-aminomutase